ncbi:MAG: N-acetyltransferase [Clostridiales bacterium]|nr:N-acetyltransferase [Clostridiales bacterium]
MNIEDVFEAFNQGFSDYIIKINMSKDLFVKRFFEVEGNSLEHSFIAYDDNKPIGVVLGGIKNYEGIKTSRCGTLAIVPDYRGKGVSQGLMELHRSEALKQECKQMFLEVIVGNDRAINFYNKLKYEKIYDLYYYTLNDVSRLKNQRKLNIIYRNINISQLKAVREKNCDVHLNWQNDMDYIEKSENQITLGAFINSKLVGVISGNKNSRISFIWVDNIWRNQGIGTSLVIRAAKELFLSKVTIGLPNNTSIQGFIKKLGFEKDKLSQYEMYYTL